MPKNPSEKWFAKMRSPEFREKMRKSALRLGLKPPKMWGNKVNLGRKHTEEWKRNHSNVMKELGIKPPTFHGKNHPSWKGGISQPYRVKNASPKPEQCEICGTFGNELKRGLYCDHDHKTGKTRGWICLRCNTILGMAKDNTETLLACIEYLKKYRA